MVTATADQTRCGRSRAGRNPRLTSCRLPLSLSPHVNKCHIQKERKNHPGVNLIYPPLLTGQDSKNIVWAWWSFSQTSIPARSHSEAEHAQNGPYERKCMWIDNAVGTLSFARKRICGTIMHVEQ